MYGERFWEGRGMEGKLWLSGRGECVRLLAGRGGWPPLGLGPGLGQPHDEALQGQAPRSVACLPC
jgi:hypothetical protein